MSILQKIFHSKNSAGNYDEYHFKTDAEVVMMSKDSSEPISTGKISKIANVTSVDVGTVPKITNNGFLEKSNVKLDSVSQKEVVISYSLTTNWASVSTDLYSQVINQTLFSSSYTVTANTRADITAEASTIKKMIDKGTSAIYIVNDNKVLTAYAVGVKPTEALDIQIALSEVIIVVFGGVFATTQPIDGISYINGLPNDWNIMKEIGAAISRASEIINANTTGSVYVYKENAWAYKITPGDTINVTSQIGTYTYAVMGFNNFALTNQNHYSGTHTAAGLTFGAVDCVTTAKMNSTNTNSGGWGKCEMRTSTMLTLQSGMPDTLAEVKVPYVDYNNQSTILYSDDYMFLPAEKEVFGTRSQSPTTEANALTQFAYYKNGGSKIKNISGSAVSWWLRSVTYSYSNIFCGVSSSGGTGIGGTSLAYGAAPCFCV